MPTGGVGGASDSAATTRGVAASLAASVGFGFIFLLSGLLHASSGEIFAWRVVVAAGFYALLLTTGSARRYAREYWAVLRARAWNVLLLVLLSALVGAQLWLFAWAPVHGYALDASLGYLLLPIVLVAAGRFAFRSTVAPAQWVAVGLAGVAVAIKLAVTASISWVTFAVCLGYAAYFVLRRVARLDNQMAFGFELVLLAPFAIALGLAEPAAALAQTPVLFALGLMGALSMWLYLLAARTLSMPIFGLLSYVEPILLFVAALLLGEHVGVLDLPVYGLLAVALVLLAVNGFLSAKQRR